MIETERMRGIAKRLLEKTKLRQVNWIPDATDDTKEHGCTLILGKSVLVLRNFKPKAEADSIKLVLVKTGSEIRYASIASFESYVGDAITEAQYDSDQQREDSELLTELYSEATKVAYKWDEVLADIDGALARPGKVGLDHLPVEQFVSPRPTTKEPAHAQRR